MGKDRVTTAVRMPVALRETLEGKAKMNSRSLSGEIMHRLKMSLEKEEGPKRANA